MNSGYEFYKNVLGSPRFVVAPMVDQSELAWRMLSRRHGAQLCYSPMLHADVFSRDATYRKDSLQTCSTDKPLIVQFCGNNPETLLKSCQLCVGQCVGVDLNLGCPQAIARRGNYGAFLQDDWELVHKLINTVHTNLPQLPITAKIRVFESVEKTVNYAKMIENAGAQIITVHGRTREQKGALTGLADWAYIKAVKDNVSVPVFANGNIQMPGDVEKCLEETGVDAVMTAEGNLHNPYLFDPTTPHPAVWDVCAEYIELVKQYPCPISFVRAHIFKLLHHCLPLAGDDVRQRLGVATDLDEMTQCVDVIRQLFLLDHEKYLLNPGCVTFDSSLVLPPWICQPYYRPTKQSSSVVVEASMVDMETKRQKRMELEHLSSQSGISKTRLKKLKRQPHKLANWLKSGPPVPVVKYVTCICGSPIANKCDHKSCRKCCKTHCCSKKMSCAGHQFLYRNHSTGKS